jgi:hypothetical protein
VDQTEIERLIGDLEIAVDRVRSLYEQYFMGIEKLEPTVPRKDIDRRIHILRKEQIRNTALRFRFQMVLQRYNTYQTHWQRICRDIENGTYKRHVIRALRRFGSKRPSQRPPSSPAPKAERSFADELAELDREFAPAELLSDKDVELEEEPPTSRRPLVGSRTGGTARPPPPSPRTLPPRPTRPPTPRTMPPRPPSSSRVDSRPIGPPSSRPPASPGRAAPSPHHARPAADPRRSVELPEERVRQLYAQYIETRRRQNESTATITYEAVARSLQESSAKLRQRLGKPVDFEVTVKDGRAIIRPVVK